MIFHKGEHWQTIIEFGAANGKEAQYAKNVGKRAREAMPRKDVMLLRLKAGEAGYPNIYWFRKGAVWPFGPSWRDAASAKVVASAAAKK